MNFKKFNTLQGPFMDITVTIDVEELNANIASVFFTSFC